MDRSLALNRASWDDRAALHAQSPDYRVAELAGDPSALSGVVRFDRGRLGDVTGLRTVHLQCHIGSTRASRGRHCRAACPRATTASGTSPATARSSR